MSDEQQSRQSEDRPNIYQKLAKIRKLVDIIRKDKDGYKFKYSDINEILAKVKGGMEREGLSLIPEVVPGTSRVVVNTFTTKKPDKTGKIYEIDNTEYLFHADMNFVWVNNDNPEERIAVPWCVVGSQADPSQAYGSGITYCTRYFLLSYFQIAQDNDVDKYRSEKQAAINAEKVEQVSEIIKAIDLMIKTYLSDHADDKVAVKQFASGYAKDGNYFSIKEPLLAAKMLNDFKAKFLKEE